MSKSQNKLSFEEYLNDPEAIKRDQKQLFSNLTQEEYKKTDYYKKITEYQNNMKIYYVFDYTKLEKYDNFFEHLYHFSKFMFKYYLVVIYCAYFFHMPKYSDFGEGLFIIELPIKTKNYFLHVVNHLYLDYKYCDRSNLNFKTKLHFYKDVNNFIGDDFFYHITPILALDVVKRKITIENKSKPKLSYISKCLIFIIIWRIIDLLTNLLLGNSYKPDSSKSSIFIIIVTILIYIDRIKSIKTEEKTIEKEDKNDKKDDITKNILNSIVNDQISDDEMKLLRNKYEIKILQFDEINKKINTINDTESESEPESSPRSSPIEKGKKKGNNFKKKIPIYMFKNKEGRLCMMKGK